MKFLRRLQAILYWSIIELLLGVVLIGASIAGLVNYEPTQGEAAVSMPIQVAGLFWVMIVAGAGLIIWAYISANRGGLVVTVRDGRLVHVDPADPAAEVQLASGRGKPYPMPATNPPRADVGQGAGAFPPSGVVQFLTQSGELVEWDMHASSNASNTVITEGKPQ